MSERALDEWWIGLDDEQYGSALVGSEIHEIVKNFARLAWQASRERCAVEAGEQAERLKHTSHKDGLGMGDQRGEQQMRDFAAKLREGE